MTRAILFLSTHLPAHRVGQFSFCNRVRHWTSTTLCGYHSTSCAGRTRFCWRSFPATR